MTTNRLYIVTGLFLMLLLTAGCNSQTSGNGGSTNSDGGSTGPATDSTVASTDAGSGDLQRDGGTTGAGGAGGRIDGGAPATPNGVTEIKPAPKFPEIKLSEQHKATCLLAQGDTMPDFELPGLDGQTQKLSALLGEQFTVVFFWPGEGRIAVREAPQQLTDFQIDVAEAFAERGVKVVGISHKQAPEVAKGIVDAAEVSFPVLLDESGDAFAQLATELLPRTYLLDGERRILWFDLLYSFDTMRNLKQALTFVLADDAAGNPAQEK